MSFYPKLFETPNAINLKPLTGEDRLIDYDEEIAYAFSYDNHKEKFYIQQGATHGGLPGPESRGPCSGRLFCGHKVITFWRFPKDKTELYKVLNDIDKNIGINIIKDPDWKIEMPINDEYKSSVIDDYGGWGTWEIKGDDITYIPIDQYTKPYSRSEEELAQQHVLSPLLKKKREVPYGFGSKNPKYIKNRQWQMANLSDEGKQEKFYPKLNENPDVVLDHNGDVIVKHYTFDSGPMPFGFYKEKLYIEENGGTHENLASKHDIPIPNDDIRKAFKYSGRLWYGKKLITFWSYPPISKFKTIINKLSKAIGQNMWTDKWKIEVVMNDDDYTKISKPRGGNVWDNQINHTELIPIPSYVGSKKRSEEELKTRHLEPPIAGKKPVPYGFGSKNPKYMQKRQWQMANIADESFYPKLLKMC